MAIAFNNITATTALSVSPATFSHSCSGNDRILFVYLAYAGSAGSITGVTYNGVAMTQSTAYTGNAAINEVWVLNNPSSGSNTVSVTFTGGVSSGVVLAGSYTGARQSSQPEVTKAITLPVSGVSISDSVTTVSDNSWTLGFCSTTVASGIKAGSGTTERGDNAVGAITIGLYDTNTSKTPPGSSTITVDVNTGSGQMDLIIYGIAPVFPSSGSFLQYF